MQLEKKNSLTDSGSGPLLLPNELLEALPLLPNGEYFIQSSRQTIKNILAGIDPRTLLIVGPCSIHDVDSTLEYASRLKVLSQSISDAFFVVMRVYFEKPRSVGGWKGFALDPHLNGSHDISSGLHLTRQILLRLAEIELPAAAEFLEPTSGHYFGDLISWGCVGARTTESQIHRQMASGLGMPMAFKNNTSGNIEVAVNGIYSASHPHVFMALNREGKLAVVQTSGNPSCHLVLRGGREKSNYDPGSIAKAFDCLEKVNLPACVVIDCSHDNSKRNYENQATVFQSVIKQIQAGNKKIRGLCLESHLNHGKQPFPLNRSDLQYGVSLTDSCLGWDATKSLVLWGYEVLKNAALIFVLCLGLSSCRAHSKIVVSSEYVTHEDLASFRVGTPDPALNRPPVGQKIYIRWNLPDLAEKPLTCKLYLRFRDRSEAVESIELPHHYGIHVYALMDQLYFTRRGILSYKVEIFAADKLVEECRHHMWVDLITFSDENA